MKKSSILNKKSVLKLLIGILSLNTNFLLLKGQNPANLVLLYGFTSQINRKAKNFAKITQKHITSTFSNTNAEKYIEWVFGQGAHNTVTFLVPKVLYEDVARKAGLTQPHLSNYFTNLYQDNLAQNPQGYKFDFFSPNVDPITKKYQGWHFGGSTKTLGGGDLEKTTSNSILAAKLYHNIIHVLINLLKTTNPNLTNPKKEDHLGSMTNLADLLWKSVENFKQNPEIYVKALSYLATSLIITYFTRGIVKTLTTKYMDPGILNTIFYLNGGTLTSFTIKTWAVDYPLDKKCKDNGLYQEMIKEIQQIKERECYSNNCSQSKIEEITKIVKEKYKDNQCYEETINKMLKSINGKCYNNECYQNKLEKIAKTINRNWEENAVYQNTIQEISNSLGMKLPFAIDYFLIMISLYKVFGMQILLLPIDQIFLTSILGIFINTKNWNKEYEYENRFNKYFDEIYENNWTTYVLSATQLISLMGLTDLTMGNYVKGIALTLAGLAGLLYTPLETYRFEYSSKLYYPTI